VADARSAWLWTGELLVVACRRVRQGYFAGIAKIGHVRLHAGFKAALASLRICSGVLSGAACPGER